ncbi:hypothetical protein BaRGS_00037202 [Batillaria attramentaria]|uniref:Ribosomal protein L7Ae/L30e/S12e/Gadd45 domain-containing protein n=1 Tax=Batillaria attramentaria TaxID=370345 RepID=A0ABD0J9P4_9CAEN
MRHVRFSQMVCTLVQPVMSYSTCLGCLVPGQTTRNGTAMTFLCSLTEELAQPKLLVVISDTAAASLRARRLPYAAVCALSSRSVSVAAGVTDASEGIKVLLGMKTDRKAGRGSVPNLHQPYESAMQKDGPEKTRTKAAYPGASWRIQSLAQSPSAKVRG